MSNIDLNIINDDDYEHPSKEILLKCYNIVLEYHNLKNSSINVNIVSNDEIKSINNQYRKKDKATNILSFPFDKPEGLPDDIMDDFLGDIIIAPDVLEKEAIEQNKTLDNHWCHIFIHGILHLLGYDHKNDKDADEMETLEIKLLQELNIPNPYKEDLA
ncbi:rRNA maturation RNase YbeY [Francisella frigiditurris]|uniref:Endoribonuclease YbeY n=1 Tax=Francisella frigiditurris TaxID=1542390 RepID=A0A1J0KS92_9GAMM|nr:rRNA maturation RNase YbeY [Francisella frigiditurris]APC96645.1 putative rRNA maturation factor YbeY [Francisella frigiditurris]